MDFSGIFSGLANNATPWGALFGAGSGLIKEWLGNRHEAKMAEIQDRRDDKERAHDLALGNMEIEKDNAAAAAALTEAELKADSAALISASQSQDKEITGLSEIILSAGGWARGFAAFVMTGVTATQKMIRPFLTVYAVALSHYIFIEVNTLVGGFQSLGHEQLLAVYMRVIVTILNLAECGFMFWFVSRPRKTGSLKS